MKQLSVQTINIIAKNTCIIRLSPFIIYKEYVKKIIKYAFENNNCITDTHEVWPLPNII